jgi:hypothetical protein
LDADGFPHSLLHHSSYESFRNNGKMIELNVDGRLVRGVILPRKAFGDYQYGSLIKYDEFVLVISLLCASIQCLTVRHSFHGSWKGKFGKIKQREKIPAS